MKPQMSQGRPARRTFTRAASICIVLVMALLGSTLSVFAGPAAPQAVYTIGDFVWSDKNHDGLQGSVIDEPGIANVELQLWRRDTDPLLGWVLVSTTNTDATGHYLFTTNDLTAITTIEWEVRVPISNFNLGMPLNGGLYTDGPYNYNQQPFTANFGQDPSWLEADFGYYFPPTAVSLASFSAGPTANLLWVGLGGAALAAGLVVWGARRRRAVVVQQ
jgi:hypothetical protein